eukprot:TRINITY_DN38794_c0_g1_i1.p1 TRINITY_DN38794_c0_g1~~TRINITY_DN38794_c0_g1_i1.p1  ORF type:complete len:273 (-),score=52.23 TRINITY_DN38794_c0_g1_i1:388-1206(-)
MAGRGFSEAYLDEFKKTFDLFPAADRDLKALLLSLGWAVGDAELDDMRDAVGKSRSTGHTDSDINFDDLLVILERRFSRKPDAGNFLEACKVFDPTASGYITLVDLTAAAEAFGEVLSQEEFTDIVVDAFENGFVQGCEPNTIQCFQQRVQDEVLPFIAGQCGSASSTSRGAEEPSHPASSEAFTVQVLDVAGSEIASVVMDSSATVQMLQQQIASTVGIPAARQTLLTDKTSEVNLNVSLAEAGIADGDSVTLIVAEELVVDYEAFMKHYF